MKALVALLALVGFVQAVEVTPFSELSVHNLTLTRCPAGTDNETYVRYCGRTGTEIVSPLEQHEAPSYGNPIGQVFEWEAPHSLTWTKKDDSPVNFTIRIGRYYMVKEITTERHFNFTFEGLATKLITKGNDTTAQTEILGTSTMAVMKELSFDVGEHVRLSVNNFYLLPSSFYHYIQEEMQEQKSLGESDGKAETTKKWRIGVGVGVGVGTPLLMTAAYFLGRRHGKHPMPAKP